ncbi:hypothetical protein RFI_14487 [Reticulomyxa filosa]|uniref:ER membrane protein complex subunit 1 n=1 Tax=Reticulomyxa filosa TaxID=46433 RepID=X6N9X1_RETFI|nr:hypothetical protein RFI_14487 [Reticulomyxa filosa]|eukprot:ETO22708.1 hypothetical protein RFI_14487 [Reticulomyxa filosa]
MDDGALEWESAQYNSQNTANLRVVKYKYIIYMYMCMYDCVFEYSQLTTLQSLTEFKADMVKIARNNKEYDILTIDSNDMLTLFGYDSSISWKSLPLLSNFPDHSNDAEYEQVFREGHAHRMIVRPTKPVSTSSASSSSEEKPTDGEKPTYDVWIATWTLQAKVVISHVVIDAFRQMKFVKQSSVLSFSTTPCAAQSIHSLSWLSTEGNSDHLFFLFHCTHNLFLHTVHADTLDTKAIPLKFDVSPKSIRKWDVTYANNKPVLRINGNVLYTFPALDATLHSIPLQIVPLQSPSDSFAFFIFLFFYFFNAVSAKVCGNSHKYVIDFKKGAILRLNEKKPVEYLFANGQEFLQDHGPIERCWSHGSNAIALVTKDFALSFIHLPQDSNKAQLKWVREESLGLPVAVHMFDQTKEDIVCKNEAECEAYYHSTFPSLSQRIVNDLKKLKQNLFSVESLQALPKYAISTFRLLLARIVSKVPVLQMWLPPDFFAEDELVFSSIAFEKVVTVYSQSNKLFGIETETGHTLWSVYLPSVIASDTTPLEPLAFDVVDILKIREHPPHLLIILSDRLQSKSWLMSIGSPFHSNKPSILVQSLSFQVQTAILTSWTLGESGDKIVLLVDSHNKVHIFPENKEAQHTINSNRNSIYFHILDRKQDALMGFGLMANRSNANDLLCNLIWSKSFRNTQERIVDVYTQPHGQQIVNAMLSIVLFFFSYLFTLQNTFFQLSWLCCSKDIAPGTKGRCTRRSDRASRDSDDDSDDDSFTVNRALHVYLIDSVTGRVYTHDYHANAAEPVSLLLYENKFVYSFWNTKTQLSEVLVADMWLNDPNDLNADGHGYVVSSNPLGTENTFSSFNAPLPIITTQAYNYQYGIEKLLCVTNTKYSITNKWILIKLTSGSVVAIDGHFLNSRRPVVDELYVCLFGCLHVIIFIYVLLPFYSKEEHQEEKLRPYLQFLPFNTLTVVSHEYTLNRLKSVISVGSTIESTTLIFGSGLDMFYRRLTPSDTFDRISDDFDFLVLFGMLVGIVVAIVVTKYMGQRYQQFFFFNILRKKMQLLVQKFWFLCFDTLLQTRVRNFEEFHSAFRS